jgi:peroxiredoxin Q/BCP
MPQKALAVGDALPEFALPSQHGETVGVHSLLKKGPLVLFFYPKDNTSVCTKEVCAFRDSYQAFTEAGASVVGVSSDDVESHERFATQHGLPFLLLADQDAKVRQLLGVGKTLGIMPGRVTYVIDQKGIVQLVFSAQMSAQPHIDEALKVVRRLATPSKA